MAATGNALDAGSDGGVYVFPMSFAQQRLWFLDRLDPGSASYNIPAAMQLDGRLDVEALSSSLEAIVTRHETLRTTFAVVDGEPRQVIAEPRRLELPVTDLGDLPEPVQSGEVRRLAQDDAAQPFDLARGPLFRTRLLRLAPDRHVLLMAMHHIVSDGWSMGVLIDELARLYADFSAGRPPSLPDLLIQYADFAVWQQDWLSGDRLQGLIDHWKRCLAGAPHVLDLPTDRPRPLAQSFRGAHESFAVAPELTARLEQLAQRSGATLLMALFAAFAVLLHRLSLQDDILIGMPIANRTRSEVERLIGLFANTLVLRADLSGDPTFTRLLERVRRTALDAYAHQDLPFEQLVEALQPERSLSRSSLFQVMFVMQNLPLGATELPGLRLTPLGLVASAAKFDLTVSFAAEESGLSGQVEYVTDLFDAATIRRLIGHLQMLLAEIARDPDRPVSALPILDAGQRQQSLTAWNRTAADDPDTTGIEELIAQQAARTPEATAVLCGGVALRYGELNARANRLARHLRRLGVGPEVRVGVFVERTAELPVALLGVLKAGGAYVPLDPIYPPQRLAAMLEDAAVPVVLTLEDLAGALPAAAARVVRLDADWPAIAAEAADDPDGGAGPEHPAYVIYTSGSTGRPKGVSVRRRGLSNFLMSMRREPGLAAGDVLLAVTTVSFDIAALELFLPLMVGARVVLADRETAADGARLGRLLAESGATVMQATPATWRLLLAAGWTGQPGLTILCGGEALPGDLAAALLGCGRAVWNLYGPTETTVWSALHRVELAAGRAGEEAEPIGRPIANTQIYILDRHLEPVPVGVAGDLFIGGTGLARGYLDRPALTAERFVPDPFGAVPGGRLYRTGDLARYRADGVIAFLGRIDHQVKIRGYRIELGEIETALRRHPGIANAVVVSRRDSGEVRLVAYLVPAAAETRPAVQELRQHLQQMLPAYMVPAAFVLLDALPLTPNGKIDRKARPPPADGGRPSGAAFVAPRNQVEMALAQIWERTLGRSPIGMHDNFFDLGGHSLSAVRLIEAVRQELGADLPLAALFQGPTVEGMAALLHRARTRPPSPAVMLNPAGDRPPLFFVPGAGGDVFYLYPLVRRLGADQPFCGLRAIGLDGEAEPPTRIETIAERYTDAILELRPHGPYRLGEHSFGGHVAFAMVQELLRRGHAVARLIVLDTVAPVFMPPPDHREDADWVHEIGQVIGRLFGLDLGLSREELAALDPAQQIAALEERLRRASLLSPYSGTRQLARVLQVYKTAHRIRYLPQEASPVPINLFKAVDTKAAPADIATDEFAALLDSPAWGWDRLTTQAVDIHAVPGDHNTMLTEPQVGELAVRLRRCLDGAG